jgi:acyl-coenzyme A synthetase/AMP-(fatty) acid ligase
MRINASDVLHDEVRRADGSGLLFKNYDLADFKALFLAGERCDPDTLRWAEDHLRVPVIDHWWQTETGWPICANCLGIEQLPVKPGSPTKPVPGMDVRVVDQGAEDICREVVEMVRHKIGPVAAFKTALVVPSLPKTRSGKILRGTMQKIADGDDYKTPATIDDAGALTEVREALKQVGYAKNHDRHLTEELNRPRVAQG